MKNFFLRIYQFFNIIESKIAFYPSLLAIAGFVLAILMVYLESQGVSQDAKEAIPQLLVQNGDTALTVLSACLGGLISLMVFSFSMVMLLLSQASNNYSPRLLPGLISNKKHQIILGLFLSTILYIIFTLFSIEPSEDKYTLPGISVLLGILLTIGCLVAFIYFIHNISQTIQIGNILDAIFADAKNSLILLIEKEKHTLKNFPDTSGWIEYQMGQSGYIQNVSVENLLSICREEENMLYMTIPKGLFALSNSVFLKSKKQLKPETVEQIKTNISFARAELVTDNYTLSYKQITEIAVKAMSPGINDPGTAINAIDYLTELLALRMRKRDYDIHSHQGKVLVKLAVLSFQELIYFIMASLRTYCAHDPVMVQKLLFMLHYLQTQPAVETSYRDVVSLEIETLRKQAQQSLDSERDVAILQNIKV